MKSIREWIVVGAQQQGCDMETLRDAFAFSDSRVPAAVGWSNNTVPDKLGQELATVVGTALKTHRLDDQIAALCKLQQVITWTQVTQ
jgi:hypothetical protein